VGEAVTPWLSIEEALVLLYRHTLLLGNKQSAALDMAPTRMIGKGDGQNVER
jgi:hypothetical protein